MTETRYGRLIVARLKGPDSIMASLAEYEKFGKRILWMDGNVVEGAFQMNCSWYLGKNERSPESHAHGTDELIGFYGSDWNDPYNLGAEIEFWIDDEKIVMDRSALVFVPAGVRHSPLWIRSVDHPVIHFSVLAGGEYISESGGWKKLSSSEARNCVVTELKIPPEKLAIADRYNKYAFRILWMDENVVPAAFHINTAWFFSQAEAVENVPHTHDDDEIIGFIGSDPNKPEDLGADVEIMLGDEKHIITKSSMIFVPAGLKHCPLVLRRVDRPIFHFTTVPGKRYFKKDLPPAG